MSTFRRLADLDLDGNRVLMRVDFNVPLDGARAITNNQRIEAALPTIRYALEQGGAVVLMSHLGRPNGERVAKYSLRPVAAELERLLGRSVTFVDDCVGPAARSATAKDTLQPGAVVLLENVRFHLEEEGARKVKHDDGTTSKVAADSNAIDAFRKALSEHGDVFVNDAFGTSHRAHSSVVGPTAFLPCAAGLLLQRELEAFERVLHRPERPFVAILGGAKVSDKLPVIEHLLPKVDTLIIGGAMAYTFLREGGLSTGKSLVETDLVDAAGRIVGLAREAGKTLLLPSDHVCAPEFAADAPTSVHEDDIPDGLMGLDIGPKTIARYVAALQGARTVVWNGPMGVFEMDAFCRGTEAVAQAVAQATNSGAFTVVGGGDSVAAAEKLGITGQLSHVSTGGGASLELLEGKALPGVHALHL
ncbi:MAG: phosphoglycerate kinase [Planctomycetes bacterium]|nr:phosphoglycerate kinase [Planctomycetota bacterium]